MLMKSIGESQIDPKNDAESSSTPQVDPNIGTLSQCYEPGQLATGERVKAGPEMQVSFEDILTDPSTKEMWKKYFRHDGEVNADLFASCVAEEYRALLPTDSETLNAVLGMLKERVSLTGTNVSLNALQIFTKERGLEEALKELVSEVKCEAQPEETDRQEQPPANEEILTELQGVKQMLDERHKTLVKKEQALREKELTLQQQQDVSLQKIADFAAAQSKACELALNKAFREKSRRLENLEQLLDSRMAVMRRYKQKTGGESASKASNSSRQSSFSFTPAGEEGLEEKLKKQRARISSLEQIHKELKTRCESTKEELASEKVKSAELAKQVEKYKQMLRVQEMKQSRQEEQALAVANTPKPKEEVKSRTTASKPTPSTGDFPTTEHLSSRDSAKTFAGLLTGLMRSLRKSLPYYISVYKEQEEKAGKERNGLDKIKIGELLYPAMGEIMPDLVDSVRIFSAAAINPEQLLPILEVVWETINFAFETQVMPQWIGVSKAKRTQVKSIEYKSSSASLRKLPASDTSGSSEDSGKFPIYPLFSNQQVTRLFLRDVENAANSGDGGKKVPGSSKKKTTRFSDETERLEILGCLLGLVLTDSGKKAKQAIDRLRQIMNERDLDRVGTAICGYRGISAIAAASTVNTICENCIGLFLGLSIGPCKSELFLQLSSPECINCIMSAFENALAGNSAAQQDDLIVLLHKLVVAEAKRLDKKAIGKLGEMLKEVKENVGEDRKFFLANVSSLESYLKDNAK